MRTILFLLFILAVSPLLLADTTDSTDIAPSNAAFKPAYQLSLGIKRLQAFMQQHPMPTDPQIAHFLDTQIAPFFDFAAMARLTAGRFYFRLTKEKQVQMAQEIKRLLLTRLMQELTSYQGQRIRYIPPRINEEGDTAYMTLFMINPVTYPSRIDLRLQRNAHNWVITDVAANGQSAIMHYRRELARRFMREMYESMQYAW